LERPYNYLQLLDSESGIVVAKDRYGSGGACDGSTPYCSQLDVACAPGQVGAASGRSWACWQLAGAGWSRAGGRGADWARRGRLAS